jgi:sulfite exporter TauE/SafE
MQSIDTSLAAFVVGLITSVHCVGMCGPLSCSWALTPKQGGKEVSFLTATALYHAGRIIAYTTAGAIAGLIGMVPLRWVQKSGGWILPWLLVAAFAMVGLGLDRFLPKPALLSKPLRRIQQRAFQMPATTRAALLGLVTPLLPCGPLYLMLGLAAANGSPTRGAEFSAAFALGTLPLLWLAQTQLHWMGSRLQPQTLRTVQRALATVAALVMVWRLSSGIGSDGEPVMCHGG